MNNQGYDLLNKRFGNLVFIKKLEPHPTQGGLYWLVQCDCGNQIKFIGSSIFKRKSLDCGCKYELKNKLKGKKFNHWTLLSVAKKEQGFYWNARCKCGTEKIVYEQNITYGLSKSCGCIMRLNSEEAGLQIYFKRIINTAKNRKIPFRLSYKFFKEIVQKSCHYCGTVNSNKVYHKYGKKLYRFNGIDRINSNYGYNKDNVVPCCKICNRAKLTMNYHNFINWINNLINFKRKG